MHLEVYIYAISFFIFIGIVLFYGHQQMQIYFHKKRKEFQDFLSTSHYLQTISLNYIQQSKEMGETEIEHILNEIKQKNDIEISRIEKESKEEIQRQIQKIKDDSHHKMKIMNARFVTEMKTQIINQ